MRKPWEGHLPISWERRPFWTEFRRAKTLGDGTGELLSVYRDYGVIPKASRDDNFNKPSEDLSKYQRVDAGDLVINKMKAWQGSLGVSGHSGIVSPAYFVYKAVGSLDRRFAHYLLRSGGYAQHLGAISSGIRPNQWDLEPLQLSVMPLLVPPTSAQRAIVDFLDRETAQIDAFIAKNEELITLLTERRAAVLARAVRGGLDPSVPTRDSGVEWLGRVPEHWRVSRLSRWYRVVLGKMLDAARFAATDGEYMPYVRAANLKPGYLDLADVKMMPFTTTEQERLAIRAGDLLVVEGGASFGVSAYVAKDLDGWGFQKTVNRARAIRSDSTQFLSYQLEILRSVGVLGMLADASTIPHLTAEKLERLYIAVPPRAEQHAIVEYVERETRAIAHAITASQRAIELARERRAALISAAVTGKIDVGVSA